MATLWFVCPAAGRVELARICLRHLRVTCDQLTAHGVEASAVVVADDENLDTAWELGFQIVERDNQFLSRKYNDGIDLACNPQYNPRPVDYVVPIGSDDWVDWRLFLDLPPSDTVMGFQALSVVRPDGAELNLRRLSNVGGCGIRVFPRQVVERLGFRPGDPDRPRGCDTSMLGNLRQAIDTLKIVHAPLHPLQIVDWKSHEMQLTPYTKFRSYQSLGTGDPFELLQGRYPAVFLEEMREHYAAVAA